MPRRWSRRRKHQCGGRGPAAGRLGGSRHRPCRCACPLTDWVELCERAEELDLSRNALICEIIAAYLAHPDQFPIGD